MNDDCARLKLQQWSLKVVDFSDEGECIGRGRRCMRDFALQCASVLVAFTADGDGAEGADGVCKMVTIAFKDGGETGKSDALRGRNSVYTVGSVAENVLMKGIYSGRKR